METPMVPEFLTTDKTGWTRIFLTAKYANHAKGRWEGRKEENLTTDFTDFDGWESAE
jgi:hypothetical protein